MKPIPRNEQIALVILLAVLAVQWFGGGVVAQQVTAAVYVYEQRQGSVPPAVLAGIDKLNRSGIEATTFDVDTTDGTGETPDQYKAALTAAKEKGLPEFVVSASGRIVRTCDVATEEDVVRAAK